MFRFRVFSLLSILMLFGVSAYGRDSGTYTIKAVILDKTGEPLSGATMQLRLTQKVSFFVYKDSI